MMQDQESLTLRWHSLLGGGSDIMAAIVPHKGRRNFDYRLILSHSCMIIQDAKTNMVDAPLTLIFKRS